jgi:hypothetical protein
MLKNRMKIHQPSRRDLLKFGSSTLASATVGCKALLGEETIEAFIDVFHSASGKVNGYTEYELGVEAGPDDGALLKRVLLRAPDGLPNLRFIQSIYGEAVIPSARTPLVEGGDFPADDTMAALDVLYEDDLRPFFPDGKKIRIEWTGTIDVTYAFPPEGLRVTALIVVEVI